MLTLRLEFADLDSDHRHRSIGMAGPGARSRRDFPAHELRGRDGPVVQDRRGRPKREVRVVQNYVAFRCHCVSPGLDGVMLSKFPPQYSARTVSAYAVALIETVA